VTLEPALFRYVDAAQVERAIALPADALAFTFCQVPVVYRRGARRSVVAARRSSNVGGAVPPDAGS